MRSGVHRNVISQTLVTMSMPRAGEPTYITSHASNGTNTTFLNFLPVKFIQKNECYNSFGSFYYKNVGIRTGVVTFKLICNYSDVCDPLRNVKVRSSG